MDIFKDEQNIWHIIFSLLFFALVGSSYLFLVEQGRMPSSVSLFDTTLLVLATFRLTRLFVYDHIAQFVRDLFLKVEAPTAPGGAFIRTKPATGPRRTLASLMGCPWCFGVWAGFTVAFFYFLTPHAWFFIFALALAGLGSLLQILANLIGWSAEFKKRTVEGPGGNSGQHSGTCG